MTPTHYSPHILLALDIAAGRGLRLPLVYNTCGWEQMEILRILDGVVDIYLPDFKYACGEMAATYSTCVPDDPRFRESEAGEQYSPIDIYPDITRMALLEMHRQVGVARPAADGLVYRGLMIRHLVMPNNVGGVSLGMALGAGLRARRKLVPLRPPGGQDESEFAARCIGCGACIAVCPTGGLRPLVSLDRLDALFTPRLVPRVGPCLPECSACGDACPTGAIPRFAPADKPDLRIGTAEIDHDLCLPWATGERCVVCVDACPAGFAAVTLRAARPRVFRPFVDPTLCTGCGICEHSCPVEGLAAIRVGNRAKETVDAG